MTQQRRRCLSGGSAPYARKGEGDHLICDARTYVRVKGTSPRGICVRARFVGAKRTVRARVTAAARRRLPSRAGKWRTVIERHVRRRASVDGGGGGGVGNSHTIIRTKYDIIEADAGARGSAKVSRVVRRIVSGGGGVVGGWRARARPSPIINRR